MHVSYPFVCSHLHIHQLAYGRLVSQRLFRPPDPVVNRHLHQAASLQRLLQKPRVVNLRHHHHLIHRGSPRLSRQRDLAFNHQWNRHPSQV